MIVFIIVCYFVVALAVLLEKFNPQPDLSLLLTPYCRCLLLP